ncbi:MAG: fibrillarin-like rRNA/tRNA 2'-O-methyltransferase [Candidatus Hodarchaeota archaeon]
MFEVEIRNHPKYSNVYISGSQDKLRLYTKNLTPGKRVYGEKLVLYRGEEYREWDPYRSKLAAVILKNPQFNFFSNNLKTLYLGASSGTTISHLSDITPDGVIYGVEFAERSIRQLIQNTQTRKNIIPILADANYPSDYAKSIFTSINLIYQDIAQPNQAEIALKNCKYYLKSDGLLILAIKSQSIDSIQKSDKIYAHERKVLENDGYKVIESYSIHQYAANHMVLLVKK